MENPEVKTKVHNLPNLNPPELKHVSFFFFFLMHFPLSIKIFNLIITREKGK